MNFLILYYFFYSQLFTEYFFIHSSDKMIVSGPPTNSAYFLGQQQPHFTQLNISPIHVESACVFALFPSANFSQFRPRRL